MTQDKRKSTDQDTQVIARRTVVAPTQGDAANLVVIYGPENLLGRRIQLPRSGQAIIGRSSDAGISLDHQGISRQHSVLLVKPEGYFLADMDSTNGTFINDRRVAAKGEKLNHGDKVQIGLLILKFISGQDIEMAYHDELYKLVSTDGMLGIPNRRFLLEAINRELSRARRHARPLTLIMFDIDHFKNINDAYGHLAGDYILRELADLIKSRIRKEDTFGRYGGEEFLMVLPEIVLKNAVYVAEKIRRLIEATDFRFQNEPIKVTVSLGVAQWEPSINSFEEFVAVVDRRLYAAKQAGRNRVMARDE